jgi:hypothetical protein
VSVIPVLQRQKQEDREFEAKPGLHSETLYLKKKKKEGRGKEVVIRCNK